jgi:hypothetical protein
LATCAETRTFVGCSKLLSVAVPSRPPKTAHKLEKKPTIIERRALVQIPKVEDLPPQNLPTSFEKSGGKKQAFEHHISPVAAPPPQPHLVTVPSLNLSKISSLNCEGGLQHAGSPAVCLLSTRRALPPSAFMTIVSDRPGVSFCMPKGMNRQFSSRHLKLAVPVLPKHHPILTSRRAVAADGKHKFPDS